MYTFKEDNAVTKLVLNSGKSSLMNTVLTLLEPNAVIPTCNSNVSTFNTTKQLVDVKSLVQSLWILNLEPWTPSAQDHSANSSDLTTSYSARLEQVTTGLKVTTLKELNSLIPFWMLSEKKLKDVIAYKDSKSPTLLEVVLDLVWELF